MGVSAKAAGDNHCVQEQEKADLFISATFAWRNGFLHCAAQRETEGRYRRIDGSWVVRERTDYSKSKMRWFLHFAIHDETVNSFGRDDVFGR
jgi:hypothetical protein